MSGAGGGPDADQLRALIGYAVALSPADALPPFLRDPGRAGGEDTGGDLGAAGLRLVFDPDQIDRAVRRVDSIALGEPDLPRRLARTLLEIPLVKCVEIVSAYDDVQRLDGRIRTETAVLVAYWLADTERARLVIDPTRRRELRDIVEGAVRRHPYAPDGTAASAAVGLVAAAIRGWLESPGQGGDPRPVAFVGLPLLPLSQEDHAELLETALVAEALLDALGFRVLGPDPSLTPSSTDPRLPEQSRRDERGRLLEADVCVFIGVDADSWGASRAAAWAEANTAAVLLFTRGCEPLTRVLNHGTHRTRQLPYGDDADLARQVLERVAEVWEIIECHQSLRKSLRHAAALLPAVRQRVETLPAASWEASPVPVERAREIVSTAQEFAAASLLEVGVLRGLIGDAMVTALRAVVDICVRQALPATARTATTGGHGRDRSLDAEDLDALLRHGHARGCTPERLLAMVGLALDPTLSAAAAGYSPGGGRVDWSSVDTALGP